MEDVQEQVLIQGKRMTDPDKMRFDFDTLVRFAEHVSCVRKVFYRFSGLEEYLFHVAGNPFLLPHLSDILSSFQSMNTVSQAIVHLLNGWEYYWEFRKEYQYDMIQYIYKLRCHVQVQIRMVLHDALKEPDSFLHLPAHSERLFQYFNLII